MTYACLLVPLHVLESLLGPVQFLRGYLCQAVSEDAFPACNQVTNSEELLVEDFSKWTITCVSVGVSQVFFFFIVATDDGGTSH